MLVVWCTLQGIPRTVIFQLSGRRSNPFETVPSERKPTGTSLVIFGRSMNKAAIHAGFDRALVPLPAAVVSVVPTRRNAAR